MAGFFLNKIERGNLYEEINAGVLQLLKNPSKSHYCVQVEAFVPAILIKCPMLLL